MNAPTLTHLLGNLTQKHSWREVLTGRKSFFLRAAFVLFTLCHGVFGCASNDISIQIEGGVPSEQLAFYADSFDSPKRDLWEIAAFSQTAQQGDFKMADVSYENGRLKIQTQVGAFSNGIVISKFLLSGDFDIQVNCQIRFHRDNVNIDQLLYFAVVKQGDTFYTGRSAANVIAKPIGAKNGVIRAIQRQHGEYIRGKFRQVEEFAGSMRLIRKGDQISMFYRKQNASGWIKLDTLAFTRDNVVVLLGVHNFRVGRKSIRATESVTGLFDNFKINASSKVIESNI